MKTFVLPADTSLQNIDAISDGLKGILIPGGSARLDISEYSSPHLCVVQLVEAARRHAEAVGADFALTDAAGSGWTDVLERAGLLAEQSDTDRAFWRKGDVPQ